MKIILVRRSGRLAQKRGGGLVVSANLIQKHLQDVGVDVVPRSDKIPLDEVPDDVDLVWVYGDFGAVPAHVESCRRANIPIIINSTYDRTTERSRWMLQKIEQWNPTGWPGFHFNVFSYEAELGGSGFAKVRNHIVAIPQPIRVGSAKCPFQERKGICIGDFTKAFRPRLHRGLDVEGTLYRLHEAGIPIRAYTQYRPRRSVPEWISLQPYRHKDFIQTLGKFRLFISVVAHETFAMVPIEAQSVGTPVLYRHMPQSLTQYIGHTGHLCRNGDEMVDAALALYHDETVWDKYSQAGIYNALAHQASLLSGHLKMTLKGVISRYKTAMGDKPLPKVRQDGREVRAYWARYSNNFGDILTPKLLQHYGITPRWTGRGAVGKMVAVGSILDRVRENDVVWGTGAIPPKKGKLYKLPPSVRILAVRGPKTRALINRSDVPEVYGDPAILLPKLYTPNFTKEFEVGVIPHEVEKDIPVIDDPKVLWIDINSGMRAVIDAIARCEVIISSSLHGVIAAEVYGVPAVWVRMTNRVHGGSFKYDDYYLSTEREPAPVVLWSEGLSKVVEKTQPLPVINAGPLEQALKDYLKE